MLELAADLDNVSKAWKLMGYSRQQFYEIRRNFQTYGAEGLLDRLPGAKGPHPNRAPEAVEKAILDHALEHPGHGPLRIAHERTLKGIQVSFDGVRDIWSRHDLLTKHQRLLRLEKHVSEQQDRRDGRTGQVAGTLQPRVPRAPHRAHHTGDPVAADTLFVGHLKGVGRVYLQTVIDCYSRYAWGRLYTSKLPVTAVHVMNNDVLPSFEAHGARIATVLSDNGREYCGRPGRQPYELFLQLEEIEHRTTKVRRSQCNGSVERLHRTLLDEHFRVMGRKKFYEILGGGCHIVGRNAFACWTYEIFDQMNKRI